MAAVRMNGGTGGARSPAARDSGAGAAVSPGQDLQSGRPAGTASASAGRPCSATGTSRSPDCREILATTGASAGAGNASSVPSGNEKVTVVVRLFNGMTGKPLAYHPVALNIPGGYQLTRSGGLFPFNGQAPEAKTDREGRAQFRLPKRFPPYIWVMIIGGRELDDLDCGDTGYCTRDVLATGVEGQNACPKASDTKWKKMRAQWPAVKPGEMVAYFRPLNRFQAIGPFRPQVSQPYDLHATCPGGTPPDLAQWVTKK